MKIEITGNRVEPVDSEAGTSWDGYIRSKGAKTSGSETESDLSEWSVFTWSFISHNHHHRRLNMPLSNIAIGRPEEATHPDTLKAGLAEFISTLIFVFAGSGSGIAYNKLTDNGAATPAGLIAASIAHAFGLFVAVSVGANISGGHVNPAVTFGAFVGGNITFLRGVVYIIAQLLGSVVASLLLAFVTSSVRPLLPLFDVTNF